MLDAEDIAGLQDLKPLLPEFNAGLENIHKSLTAAAEHSERTHQEIERMRSPEYREEVRRSVAKDEAGLDAIASLLGLERAGSASPDDETKPASRVAEPGAPWTDDDESNDTEKPE